MTAILLPASPARDHYELIPTTTVAKRPPETAVEFDAPVLLLRKGRDVQLYTVDEFPCVFDGRAFAVTKDSTGEVYHVFAARNGQDSTCSCAGFTYTSNDATGGRCRHLDATTHLLSTDRLEDPEAGRPVEPWPSPEQLAADPWADDTVVRLTDKGVRALDVTDRGYVLPSDLELIERPF